VLDDERFSIDLDELKSALIMANTLNQSEIIKITSYYIALFQCVEAIATKTHLIISMEQSFQDLSRLTSISIDRLEMRVGPEHFREIRKQSDDLLEHLSHLYTSRRAR